MDAAPDPRRRARGATIALAAATVAIAVVNGGVYFGLALPHAGLFGDPLWFDVFGVVAIVQVVLGGAAAIAGVATIAIDRKHASWIAIGVLVLFVGVAGAIGGVAGGLAGMILRPGNVLPLTGPS